MPALSDSILGVESGFRRALFGKGMLFRVNVVPRYSQNLLDGPVPAGQQVYIGQRPTWISRVNPIFTADLRHLGLRQAQSNQAWFRAGYMRNSTLYMNKSTGQEGLGNHCTYVLMDYQLLMPDPETPGRGLYLGGTAMTVPPEFNPYAQYYEARLYQRGTFPSRPSDVLSFVASLQGPQQVLRQQPGRPRQDGVAQLDFLHRHLHHPCRARGLPEPWIGLGTRAGDLATCRGHAHVHGKPESVPVGRGSILDRVRRWGSNTVTGSRT